MIDLYDHDLEARLISSYADLGDVPEYQILFMRLHPEDFSPAYREIFEVVNAVAQRGGKPHDLVVLKSEAEKLQTKDLLADWHRMALAISKEGVIHGIEDAIKRIKIVSMRRKVLRMLSKAENEVHSGADLPALLSELASEIQAIPEDVPDIETGLTIFEYTDQGAPFAVGNSNEPAGRWGLMQAEEFIEIPYGEPVIVGARPGCGKTTLGLQAAIETARMGKKAHFISLELSRPKLLGLVGAYLTRLEKRAWKKGRYGEREVKELMESTGILGNLIISYPQQGVPWINIEAIMRKSQRTYGTDLFVLDYFGLIGRNTPGKGSSEAYAFAKVAGDIMNATRNMGVGMIVLAQLKAASTAADGMRPNERDYADSDALYRNANIAMQLYKGKDGKTYLHNPKNRDGEPGKEWLLEFDGATGRMTTVLRETDIQVGVQNLLRWQDENGNPQFPSTWES